MPAEQRPVRRALISAWDKAGSTEFATGLAQLGVELLCSGGTADYLRSAGLKVTALSSLTGFDQLIGGRVKTLHPGVHASILARPGEDERELEQHELKPVDLVAVDLYPFVEAAAADPHGSDPEVTEKIDVGGVALLRAAAKNFARVTAVHDGAGRALVLDEMRRNDNRIGPELRRQLAAATMSAISAYDAAIADWLRLGLRRDAEAGSGKEPPPTLQMHWRRRQLLRYGENPHQAAALYLPEGGGATGLWGSEPLQGKEMSYNNLQDARVAAETVQLFAEPACAVVKHANPCALAVADRPSDAWSRAIRSDSTSPFGGIVAFNRPLDGATARQLLDFGFLEVVLAPSFEPEALRALGTKPRLRLLQLPPAGAGGEPRWQWTGDSAGLLVQQIDRGARDLSEKDLRTAGKHRPTPEQLKDLLFAWKVASVVKSNAIVCARDGATTAVGAGQMSRVFSVQIAALKAQTEGVDLRGSVMASDAFFPFRDAVDRAAEQGIAAIVQPGGSVRDAEVIKAADELGIPMVLTGARHFRH